MDREAVGGFLSGGGEMGALTRGFDWSKTSLGSPEAWPQSLRVTVRLVLTSRHPMFIWWGPELIQFYNDAYRETMGPERHPSALGARGRECWDEIWDIIGPQIEYVMAGNGATWHEEDVPRGPSSRNRPQPHSRLPSQANLWGKAESASSEGRADEGRRIQSRVSQIQGKSC
jgi:hypothetical protein